MTSNDKTAPGQAHSVVFELDLKHSPPKVWRALTEPALLEQWLLPTIDLKLEPGAPFRLKAPPQPGWDGTVHCCVAEIEPQRKLSYSWLVGELDTVVTFTLTPTPSGTHLSIVQSGFQPNQKRNFGGARYGWRLMTGKLVEVLAQVA